MGKHRSSYSPHFKAKVALEALRGERSQAAISRTHNLNGEVVSRWRHQLVQGAAEVFKSPADTSTEQQRIAELERLVGALTLELSAPHGLRGWWSVRRWPHPTAAPCYPADPDASRVPSGENATEMTKPVCPVNRATSAPVWAS